VLQAGAEFVAAADAYVRRFIDRGIPSLYSDLKPLYADSSKAAALQELFEGYAAALRASGSMPPLQQGGAGSSSSSDNNNNRPPSSSSSSSNGAAAANGTSSSNGAGSSSSGEDNPLTWVLHYLSQHYDGLGQTAKALEVRDWTH
jgi:peptide alpha-N-acetyltransferase